MSVYRDRLPWMFTKPSAQPRSEVYFADLLKREDSAVFVAHAGHLVGVAFGLMRAAPDFPVFIQQRWGVLDGLVVDSAWRRRGIGTLLARAVPRRPAKRPSAQPSAAVEPPARAEPPPPVAQDNPYAAAKRKAKR